MQVWCVPIMGKAVKVRTVELPFVAMAWVHTTPHVRSSPLLHATVAHASCLRHAGKK